MKIYVVHYDKLTDRKINMDNQLTKNGLICEYISNYGKDKLTKENKKMFRNISDSEISVCLHHIECFKNISKNNEEYGLILEDDALLCDNFKYIINNYISQLPENWDMLFIGNGCNLHIPNNLLKKNVNIYKKDNNLSKQCGLGATRCLDSYLITKKCAQKIIEKLTLPNYTILSPVDHWLNYVIRNNNFQVYWAEPTIVTQASQQNIYNSSIR